MKGFFPTLGGAALTAMVIGCAMQQPEPVAGLDTATPHCTKLLHQYAAMRGLRGQVLRENGSMPTESLMPMYFWPRVAGTFMSATEAIATADHRLRQMRTVMEEQHCQLPHAI
jgi:hypothetical protein